MAEREPPPADEPAAEPEEAPRQEAPPPEPEPEPEPRPAAAERVYRGTGVYTALVVGLLLAAATIVFIAQNTDGVQISWIVWELDVALAAVALAAMFLGVVLAVIVGWVWRRRQRRIRTEREELERLRGAQR